MSVNHSATSYRTEAPAQLPLMGLFPRAESAWRQNAREMFPSLNPILRVLVSTDGTVTKSLESYFWEPVSVDVLSHGIINIEHPISALDLGTGDEVLRRTVILRLLKRDKPMVFAESFVRVDRLWPGVQTDLIRGRLGIGEVLESKRMAQYRSIFHIWREEAGSLASRLGVSPHAMLVCRSYSITTINSVIMVITEKFVLDRFTMEAVVNAA